MEHSCLNLVNIRGWEELGNISQNGDGTEIVGNGRELITHMGMGNLFGPGTPFREGEGPVIFPRLGPQVETKVFGRELNLEISPFREIRKDPLIDIFRLTLSIFIVLVDSVEGDDVAFGGLKMEKSESLGTLKNSIGFRK